MLDLLFTGAASTDRNEQAHELIAANLANVATPGYKGRIGSFESILSQQRSGGDQTRPSLGTDFQPGEILATGNDFDFAIGGDGFFTLQNEEGSTRYTRNGAFTLNAEGELITHAGEKVLGEEGPLIFDATGGSVRATQEGDIFQGETLVGRLRVTDFADPAQLERVSDSLYSDPGSAIEQPAEKPMIHQGFQEKSNVNMIRELVAMIATQRNLDSSHRVVRMIDRVLNRTINTTSAG